MDRSWIQMSNRLSREYEDGVKEFIKFAKYNLEPRKETILCPCIRCHNRDELSFDEVEDHVIIFGMVKGYTIWTWHGENYESSSEGDDGGCEYYSALDGKDEVAAREAVEARKEWAGLAERVRILEAQQADLYMKVQEEINLQFPFFRQQLGLPREC